MYCSRQASISISVKKKIKRGELGFPSYFLQTSKNHQALREEIWPLPTTLQEKLFGPVDALQKTTRFVAETEIQV
jgi:hypothetical protein